jgi:7-cyano-7-deazaguanine synthase
LALCCDYVQRAAARELAAAAAFCRARELPFRRLDLPWLGELAAQRGCALADRSVPLPQGTLSAPGDAASAAAVWVPARNAVLVAAAAAHAEALGAGFVLAGFNREEAATFTDNSPAFVQAATAMLATGTRTAVRVASPTLDLDKRAMVAAARRLGIAQAELWSCYGGDPAPCGRCESCLRSIRAWAALD